MDQESFEIDSALAEQYFEEHREFILRILHTQAMSMGGRIAVLGALGKAMVDAFKKTIMATGETHMWDVMKAQIFDLDDGEHEFNEH